jgi:iron complex outermembrane receptor protein
MPYLELNHSGRCALSLMLAMVLSPLLASAQTPGQSAPRLTLPTVIVTAQKEPADVQTLPVSVTPVTSTTIDESGVRTISEAGVFAPNAWFTDFSARKLSNARFRGVGASPANPAVTTYIDGVPQLSANSSNIELMDVEQIEFVRGPQSPLYGRNALGGVINVRSQRPSMDRWTGSVVAPFGNVGAREIRGSVSGPIGQSMALGVALGRQARDGFAINQVTGNDVDHRSATFGKAQFLWVPASNWEARVIVSGEQNRDGDYMLTDLSEARANPFQVSRDFEGFTDRDILSTAVHLRGEGERLTFTSSTGLVSWQTEDATDLDYSALPLATRTNAEDSFQFTQELRVASPASAPAQLSDALSLAWQSGALFFTQDYTQQAANTISPYVLSQFIDFPVTQISPDAALDDFGVGVFGQGTLTVHESLDVTLGLRFDHESKDADLASFTIPPLAPPVLVQEDRSFSNLSPQLAVAYRLQPTIMAYASASQGFKAGGFNPASPAGAEVYDEEHAWHVEGGIKSTLASGRMTANAAVFFIDWDDLQLNVPDPFVPGQFYIANVGGARSRGVEFEVHARPHGSVDLFGSLGYTHARFSNGSASGGTDLSGNIIPNTPEVTALVGTELSRPVTATLTAYGRAELAVYGAMQFDDANTAGQEAYSLANFRGGVRAGLVFAEAWIRNAFDTRYIPVALPLQFAPSGFVAEVGRPRTFGVSAGVRF